MSKTVPTPYMWAFQPQVGTAAGASQDYSTQFNWMSAGPRMVNTIRHIRDEQNQILQAQALLTETPRPVANPPSWPAALLPQFLPTPTILEIPENSALEKPMTNGGFQIAGGSVPTLFSAVQTDALTRRGWKVPGYQRKNRNYGPIKRGSIWSRSFVRGQTEPTVSAAVTNSSPLQVFSENSGFSETGMQISEFSPVPRLAGLVRSDGTFQLAGGSTEPLSHQTLLALSGTSTVPRSGGIGSRQFVKEFVPTVYYNPFSGPPNTFPDQFISNFNVISNSVDGYD